MEKDSMMLATVAIVAIVGIVVMLNPQLDLTGQTVSSSRNPDNMGCYVFEYNGPCTDLGKDWEPDPFNPGWCRNCGYT